MDAVFPLTSSLQVIYGLTPSSDSLWVEALGTPAYLKLLPGGSLPCACGLYVYSLRTVPQDRQSRVAAQQARRVTWPVLGRGDSSPGPAAHGS